ncbi:Zinc-binding dehydrogenase-like protein 1 [Elsinoe fawcettii]|nr:Zinc-binding dehydrogenase-like protein 1 [Elsinoe fawcettii]
MLLPKGGSNGLSKDGGFAQYALVDARQCVILPDDLPAVDAAPLMRAGVTIYNAIKRCELKLGQRIGIVGCGGDLGHLGLQFADAMGLRVTGVDAADGPLQLARSLGTRADIVDARATPVEEVVLKIGAEDGKTDRADMGLDAVIILPESQISFEYGTKLLRNHSLCLVVSIPVNGFRVSAWDLVFRDITVRGTILGTNEILRETVEFAAKHGVRPIKKTYALADLNGLVDEYKKGWGGKFVLDVSK